jgi:hypothetical protein
VEYQAVIQMRHYMMRCFPWHFHHYPQGVAVVKHLTGAPQQRIRKEKVFFWNI